MNTNAPLNGAADEVAEAEAELKAAQERLEAAKAKLAAAEGSRSEDADGEEPGAEDPASQADAAENATPDWVPYSTVPTTPPAPCGEPVAPPVGEAVPASAPTTPPPAAPAGAAAGAPFQPPTGYVAPGYGQAPHAGPGAVPPQQPPYGGYQQPYYQQPYAQPVVNAKDHVAAGLLAIFLGWLGIHKFYLGYNTAGFIMLAVSIVGSIFTFGLAAGVIWVISIIEGILYLTKSQSEFEQMYVFNKREWF